MAFNIGFKNLKDVFWGGALMVVDVVQKGLDWKTFRKETKYDFLCPWCPERMRTLEERESHVQAHIQEFQDDIQDSTDTS